MKNITKNKTADNIVITWDDEQISGDQVIEITKGPAEDYVHLGNNFRGDLADEWKGIVGSRLTASDIEQIFLNLTTDGAAGGDGVGGIAGVELVGLTVDSFTITLAGLHATDKITFEGENVKALIETLGDTGGKSANNQVDEFYVLNTDEGSTDSVTFQGGAEASVPGIDRFNPSSESDVNKLIDAALDLSNENAQLLTLTEDSVSVQVAGRVDKEGDQDGSDTILLTGALVKDYIRDLTADEVNTRNSDDEFVFVSADEIEASEGSSDPLVVGVNNGSSASNTNAQQEIAALVGSDIRISDATNNVETLIANADVLDQITVQDMGTSVAVFIENEDTDATDLIVYEDSTLLIA